MNDPASETPDSKESSTHGVWLPLLGSVSPLVFVLWNRSSLKVTGWQDTLVLAIVACSLMAGLFAVWEIAISKESIVLKIALAVILPPLLMFAGIFIGWILMVILAFFGVGNVKFMMF